LKQSYFWVALALLFIVNMPSLLVASMPEIPIAKLLKSTAIIAKKANHKT